jgi:hypothetical protein
MVESTARSKNSKNWKGLTRFIVTQARADFPEAKEVVLQSMKGRYPKGEMKPGHRILAEAPDWVPVLK